MFIYIFATCDEFSHSHFTDLKWKRISLIIVIACVIKSDNVIFIDSTEYTWDFFPPFKPVRLKELSSLVTKWRFYISKWKYILNILQVKT